MHADMVHTQTALFLDQKECLDGWWSLPNCEKQFGGDTSLRLRNSQELSALLIGKTRWLEAAFHFQYFRTVPLARYSH